jgi:hypothetical protein
MLVFLSSFPPCARHRPRHLRCEIVLEFILLYLDKVVKQESDSVCSSILHFFGAFVQKGENVSPPGRKS